MMLTNSWGKVWTAIIVILIGNKTGFCQFSPCPKIFQYNFDGVGWFGIVDLEILPPGQEFKLKVDVSGNGTTKTHFPYAGSLDIKINQKEKMDYKIKFPLSPGLAKLRRIVLNGNVICAVPSDGNPSVTILKLQQSTSGHIIFETSITGIMHSQNVSTVKTPILMTTSTMTTSTMKTSTMKTSTTKTSTMKTSTRKTSTMKTSTMRNKTVNSTNCGQLVGNFETSLGDYGIEEFERGTWPWLAAIYDKQNYSCSGTLIANNAVLTAASCIRNLTRNDINVYLGLHNLDQVEQTSVYLINVDEYLEFTGIANASVSKIYTHPTAKAGTADGDIALLQLSEKVEFTDFIQPACLWAGSTELKDFVGEYGYYAGWNKHIKYYRPNIPIKYDSEIISQEDCVRSDSRFVNITSTRTFCAGWRNGQGICPEYLGAGFLKNIRRRWMLRGVMSQPAIIKDEHCDLNNYAVYTDVAHYTDWIIEKIYQ